MRRDWKDRMIKDPTWAAKRPYAKEAYLSNCWVYSNQTGKLYTPEEFMDCEESVKIYRGQENTKQFRIIDPNAMMKHKEEQLLKLKYEIDNLYLRITTYNKSKQGG